MLSRLKELLAHRCGSLYFPIIAMAPQSNGDPRNTQSATAPPRAASGRASQEYFPPEDKDTLRILEDFEKSSPQAYAGMSLDIVKLCHGPIIPEKAFDNVPTLRDWYRVIRNCWFRDARKIVELWDTRLFTNHQKLALLYVASEARATGLRKLQNLLFRDEGGKPRTVLALSYADLGQWCDFMFEVLGDDDEWIPHERHILTIRYDMGIHYRLDEDRKGREKTGDPWVNDFVDSAMRRLCKGEPRTLKEDDERLLVHWSALLDSGQKIAEVSSQLFIDAVEVEKSANQKMLDGIISTTWRIMRELGPACRNEPRAKDGTAVRGYLDCVKKFCTVSLRRGSARPCESKLPLRKEVKRNSLRVWAGSERATLAIVFTDIVGSAGIGNKMGDAPMNRLRQRHFTRGRRLVQKWNGFQVKTLGDGIMAVFKSVEAALNFTIAIWRNSGDPGIRIRAGIHIGAVDLTSDDVFGSAADISARISKSTKEPEIRISEEAKLDLDRLGTEPYSRLQWQQRRRVRLKGFPRAFTLWSLER